MKDKSHILQFVLESLSASVYITLPEHHLVLAVIQRAIFDALTTDHRYQDDARRWLFGKYDGVEEEFTFDWCLEHISDYPHDLRAKILSYVKSEANRLSAGEKPALPKKVVESQ